jgi:hypothetical protein
MAVHEVEVEALADVVAVSILGTHALLKQSRLVHTHESKF